MEVNVSANYGIGIEDRHGNLYRTWKCLKEAAKCLLQLIDKHYMDIDFIRDSQERYNTIERYLHASTIRDHERDAKDDTFDRLFPDFPTYLRRTALKKAIGAVDAYHAAVANWKRGGKKGAMPTLNYDQDFDLALYDGIYKWDGFGPQMAISILSYMESGKWEWCDYFVDESDFMYVLRHAGDASASSPVLHYNGQGFRLNILYTKSVTYPDSVEVICAVDIGVNYPAVAVIMTCTGRIIDKLYVKGGVNEERIRKGLRQIDIAHRNGNHSTRRISRDIRNHNDALVKEAVRKILDFALKYNASCIVMENLDAKELHGKKKGSKGKDNGKQKKPNRRARLSQWKVAEMQKRLKEDAHFNGMRYETVNPWGTSKLYNKGEGECIRRDEHDRSKATAPDGTPIPSDLNAAINIGARYFVRQLSKLCDKALSVRKEDDVAVKEAKGAMKKGLKEIKAFSKRSQATRKTLLDALDIVKPYMRKQPGIFEVEWKSTPTDFVRYVNKK